MTRKGRSHRESQRHHSTLYAEYSTHHVKAVTPQDMQRTSTPRVTKTPFHIIRGIFHTPCQRSDVQRTLTPLITKISFHIIRGIFHTPCQSSDVQRTLTTLVTKIPLQIIRGISTHHVAALTCRLTSRTVHSLSLNSVADHAS